MWLCWPEGRLHRTSCKTDGVAIRVTSMCFIYSSDCLYGLFEGLATRVV